MSGNVFEQYNPHVMGVNATLKIGGSGIGGFLAATSGTITVNTTDDQGAAITIVNAVPVTAGFYTPLPFRLQQSQGCTIVLGGGASGTLGA